MLVTRGELDVESLGDPVGDLVLHPEQVGERCVHLRCPQRPALGGHELNGDAQLLLRALEAAIDDGVDVELARNLLQVDNAILVAEDR